MSDVNSCHVTGRLTRDVEVIEAGENKIAKFGVAINRVYYDRNKEKQEKTTFLDCQLFGAGRVDFFSGKAAKGSKVVLEGRLESDSWEDKNGGGKRSKTLLTVENFDFVATGNKSEDQDETPRKDTKKTPAGRGNKKDDDIPF